MERIILMILRSLHKVPGWWFRLCCYGRDEKFEKYSEAKRYGLLYELVHYVNRVGRIKVVSSGMENLPKENGYMLFANHQGMFDVLLFIETHGRFLSVVFKKEVANVIFVKQVARMIAAKAMDREDVRQSMRVIKEVADEVKKGMDSLKDNKEIHNILLGFFGKEELLQNVSKRFTEIERIYPMYEININTSKINLIKAFQLNMSNSSTSNFANSKIRDLEASANVFYTSLSNNFTANGYSART